MSLPLLDIMTPAGVEAADSVPCRYLVALQGIAQSGRGGVDDPGFAPLADIRSDVSLVTGLSIPRAETPGPGGRPPGPYHLTVTNPLVTGVRSTSARKGLQDITSDQIVAEAWAGSTIYDSLQFRVQKEAYIGGHGDLSMGRGGRVLTPVANPQVAWDQLFSSFTGPEGSSPGNPSAADLAIQEDRSILDLVGARTSRLLRIASAADRVRLDAHLTTIREMERRLSMFAPGGAPSPTTCESSARPGAFLSAAPGWSNETARGEFFADLIALAFACDVTRTMSWMITFWQSMMSAREITGLDEDLHSVTHLDGAPEVKGQAMSEMMAWHVSLFARLVRNLRDTPEAGGSLLDSTAAILLFEGEDGHSYNNNTSVVAGRSSVLRMGETITTSRAHPAQLLSTMMHSVGVEEDLGEVPGQISALFR